MKRALPIILLAAVLCILALLVALRPASKLPVWMERQDLRVHFVDVGQGDCILLQTPDGRNVLVDAGSADSAEDLVRYLAGESVDRIDLVVITHPHADHIGGLPRVLAEFGASAVVDAGQTDGNESYQEVLSMIRSRRIDYRLAADWPTPQVSKSVDFEVIWPPAGYSGAGESGLDGGSVVMRVKYGSVSFLLTGDIRGRAEGRLLAARRDMQSTVLKVARHGGGDSTSNEFLQVVRPEYAVISVGVGNPHGLPARPLLRRLLAAGAQVLRTDHLGTIVLTTDGERVRVSSTRQAGDDNP